MNRRSPRGQTRRRVFEFVRSRILEGQPPTTREVQEALGFRAVQSAREHLEALVAEGLLRKVPGQARGYRLAGRTSRPVPTMFVPLLGQVQAGNLTAAVEDPEGYLALPAPRSSARSLFALRVRGDSMKDAGILSGDVVIVRPQPTASSGDVVVALVEDEATVKTLRLSPRRRRVVLEPANPGFSPIVLSPEELRILGKVLEVRRYLETLPLLDELPG